MKQLINNTRDSILAAAEELFAETGIAATSLRTITALARVNLAAVNYHFGSKQALVTAVYERQLRPLNQARLAALNKLEQEYAGCPLPPADIVRAFVTPMLDQTAKNHGNSTVFMRLIAHSYTETSEQLRELVTREQEKVMTRFKAALCRALPDLPPRTVCWRLHFMACVTNQALTGTGLASLFDNNAEGKLSISAAVRQLVPFLTEGIMADEPMDANLAPPLQQIGA